MRICKIVIALCLALTIAACGGGGTGTTTVTPSTKSYKLLLQGPVPAGVNSIIFDIVLPPGVTVNVDANNNVDNESLKTSGGAQGAARAAGVLNGAIRTGIVKVTGDIPAGEIATLTVNLTGGTAPPASAFTINTVEVAVVDTNTKTTVAAQVVIQDI